MLSVRCLSCLSVTFVHCGQTVGRIKVKLGTQVGLGPGHIVLDGDPAPPPPKGHSPQLSAHIYCGQTVLRIKMKLAMQRKTFNEFSSCLHCAVVKWVIPVQKLAGIFINFKIPYSLCTEMYVRCLSIYFCDR